MKRKMISIVAILILLSGCSEQNGNTYAIKDIYSHSTTTSSSQSTENPENTNSSNKINNSLEETSKQFVFSEAIDNEINDAEINIDQSTETNEHTDSNTLENTNNSLPNTEQNNEVSLIPNLSESNTSTSTETSNIVTINTPENTIKQPSDSKPIEETYYTTDPDDEIPKITFYIDNQLVNNINATIKLVHGYIDHPDFDNLIIGNKVTVPKGNYVISIIAEQDYEIKTYPQINIYSSQNNPFNIDKITSSGNTKICQYTIDVDENCENQTLIITGEIQNSLNNPYKVSDEQFYSWNPKYKGKSFNYEFFSGLNDPNDTFYCTVLKNGSPLLPNDKLKVGDKITITKHVYNTNIFVRNSEFEDVLFKYDDNGELFIEYTITTKDIRVSVDKAPEDCSFIFSIWSEYIDFTNWKYNSTVAKRTQGDGEYNLYKVLIDKNGNETLIDLDKNTKLIPGNRLKLEIPLQYQNSFKKCDIKGGFITQNNYIVITDKNVSITAIFQ